MEHGEHHHTFVLGDVEDRVGEPAHHGPTDRVLHDGVGSGVLADQDQRAFDRIDEPRAETGLLALISTLGGVDVIERSFAQHQRWVHVRDSLRLASSQLITESGSAR